VIVNSDASTKDAVKVNNRNISHKVANGNCENKSKENKLIVTGDNHVRGCAREISKFLEKEFEVSGMIMLGSSLENVTALVHEELLKLTSDDAVVIWVGSNDEHLLDSNT
jgi:hypothetical protein